MHTKHFFLFECFNTINRQNNLIMRKLILTVSAIATLLFTACDQTSNLASKMEGTLTGTPTSLSNDIAGSTTIIETVSFTRIEKTDGGIIDVVAAISATSSAADDNDAIGTYTLTAAAEATASGTWKAIEGDEVSVTIDPASIVVKVDPDGVDINADIFTGEMLPSVDSIKPEIIRQLQERIQRDVMTRFINIRHLDDVKVNNDILRFETDNKDFTMSLQHSY